MQIYCPTQFAGCDDRTDFESFNMVTANPSKISL